MAFLLSIFKTTIRFSSFWFVHDCYLYDMFVKICNHILTIIFSSLSERPYSESDVAQPAPQPQHCRRSASSPPLTLTFDSDLEDDVFSPQTDRTNDLFSTRNLDIFRYGSPRTPAGVLLSPRRERTFTFSVTSEKHWRDKGGTDVADGVNQDDADDGVSTDEVRFMISYLDIFIYHTT